MTPVSPVGGEVDVARLREVAEAATLHPKNSLPWMVDDDENDKPLIVLAPKDVGGWDGIVVARCPKPEDALHIATFDPPTVLALLARLEAAESARDEALAVAYDDGYNDAVTMARVYGHTDHWPDEDEPRNPYRAALTPSEVTP